MVRGNLQSKDSDEFIVALSRRSRRGARRLAFALSWTSRFNFSVFLHSSASERRVFVRVCACVRECGEAKILRVCEWKQKQDTFSLFHVFANVGMSVAPPVVFMQLLWYSDFFFSCQISAECDSPVAGGRISANAKGLYAGKDFPLLFLPLISTV